MQGKRHLKARKQPVQGRSRETVALILEAAARVLERHGLEGYNTNRIAECAGVSVGSIYQYFPNKDALTLALIAEFEAELSEKVQAAVTLARGKTLRQALKFFIRSLLEAHHRRAELNRLLETEEDRLRRLIPESVAGRDYRKIVTSMLVEHRAGISVAIGASTVEDVIAIAKAMVDSALLGRRDRMATEPRILRAIEGYLCWNGGRKAA